MSIDQVVTVAGGGGFIGGSMVARLRELGYRRIRSIDFKPMAEWHQVFDDVENLVLDLRSLDTCRIACKDAHSVFNFACDMGGMGFIKTHQGDCMLSVLINTHLLMAAREYEVDRYFFSSSACIYNVEKQESPEVTALKEADAYPAMAEDGYGWEKLFSERMCRHFTEDFAVKTRVARYHNVYGPHGTYEGGREKAPAAICRKVIQAKLSGNHDIEIWGDGEQTRSFMYIDDCTFGTLKLMNSDVMQPLNVGSSYLVTINRLVDMVEDIAGIRLNRRYKLDAPQGVRGRNSDNTLIRSLLDWEPAIPLETGMEQTYRWIYDQMS